MKRKKWSEVEEQTLLSNYSDLLNSGALAKLKTREKKFRPIADHVNTVHHLQDPITFPFKWSWRDVSIKVQNMRHQYLGVKQKIRISKDDFNWKDGVNHWENFLRYKEVFGDVELEAKGKKGGGGGDLFEDCCDLGIGMECEDLEEEEEEDAVGSESELVSRGKAKKGYGGLGLIGSQGLELREAIVRREEKRREREYERERKEVEREREREGKRRREWEVRRESEPAMEAEEERWVEKRVRIEREVEEEEVEEERRRRRRMRMEEEKEEEEMEWREKMVGMQMEHEKGMMQMQAEAWQNQMQIVGLMGRLLCHFYGTPTDGALGGLALTPQVLHHNPTGGLPHNAKPHANSPSQFI